MQAWMIYGANGYTGSLIAKQAVQLGMKPVLAGRRDGAIAELARQLGCEKRIFPLDDEQAVDRALSGIGLVLNCAGPFSATSQAMISACLKHRVHYLDITGEIGVFEYAHSKHAAAQAAGVVLCPGVGFDVIPTDCVASALKEALPDASELALGFASKSRLSPGTAKTSVEGMALGGKVRKNGRVMTVPFAYKTREIDFGGGVLMASTIPWGDVATAYYSTGIPNIEVYMATPPHAIAQMRRLNLLRPLMRWGMVQRLLKTMVERRVQGPGEAMRRNTPTHVWGEAHNAAGQVKVARVRTANGYQLTIDGSLTVIQRMLTQPPTAGGYFTPSTLCGWQLVESIPGSGKIEIV